MIKINQGIIFGGIFVLLILSAFIMLAPTIISAEILEEPSETLNVSDIIFCSNLRGEKDYDAQPDAIYESGDIVLIYIEVTNFATKPVGSKYEVWLKGFLTVFDSENNVIFNALFSEYHERINSIPELLWGWTFLTTANKKDQYRVDLRVVDMISEESKMVTGYFKITERKPGSIPKSVSVSGGAGIRGPTPAPILIVINPPSLTPAPMPTSTISIIPSPSQTPSPREPSPTPTPTPSPTVTPTPVPAEEIPEKGVPGFEALCAIAGLVTVAFLVLKRDKKQR